MKYIHLIHTSVFLNRLVKLINSTFPQEEHLFIVLENPDHGCEPVQAENMVIITPPMLELPGFRRLLLSAGRIFLHGAWEPAYLNALLAYNLCRKTYWIIWGGDLFDLPAEGNRLEVARSIGGIVTHAELEYALAKEKYQVTAPWIGRGPFYDPGEMIEFFGGSPPTIETYDDGPINILVGHSASENMRHEEIFMLLKDRFPEENIKIYSSLSYGDRNYAAHVVAVGERIWGERFYALTDFMDPREYFTFLRSIHIGIFAQHRSQGLGNITSLLYFGKKVFIQVDTAHYQFIQWLGGIVHDIESIKTIQFSQFIHMMNPLNNFHAMLPLKDGSLAREEWKLLLQ